MQTLHIVAGPPAAGKSTYARALARQRKAAFLDIDEVSERVVKAGLSLARLDPADRDSPTFKSAFREPIYDTLFAIAAENLETVEVVMAGPFTRELRNPGWLEELRGRFNATVQVYYLSCPPKLRFERMKARRNPRDAAKLARWKEYLKYYGEEQPPVFAHRLVNASLLPAPPQN